jgi:hypothetical protein
VESFVETVDWNQWSAIAEILGVFAILITLIYVAVQTRQNTAAVQSSVRQAMLDQDRQSLYMAIEYPALNKRTDLTDEETIRLTAYMLAFIRMRENHWIQHQSGLLDEATWVSYRNALLPVIFMSEFGRRVWAMQAQAPREDAAGFQGSGFVAAINDWIASIDIEDSDQMFFDPRPPSEPRRQD